MFARRDRACHSGHPRSGASGARPPRSARGRVGCCRGCDVSADRDVSFAVAVERRRTPQLAHGAKASRPRHPTRCQTRRDSEPAPERQRPKSGIGNRESAGRKEMVVRSEDATTGPGKRSESRPQLPRQAAASGASFSRRLPRSVGQRSSTSPVRRQAGARLASARDRQRLSERYAQERERVEKMLASAPDPIEPPSGSTKSSDEPEGRTPPTRHVLAPVGCPVCGATQIVSDEVIQLGTLRLSECSRCDHRWTHRSRDRWAEVGATMNRPGRPNALRAVPEGAMAL